MIRNKKYRIIITLFLLITCINFTTSYLPVSANEDSIITDKLLEVMKENEAETPINYVFIELSIDEDTCIKEGAFRRTPRITESGRESERTGETDGLTKDMR